MQKVEATNSSWVSTSAIYWFLRYLNSLKKNYNVTTNDIYVAFDNITSKDIRKQLYPDYKENRLKTHSELFTQMSYLLQILDAEWVKYITLKNLEADDICVQLSIDFNREHTETLVISRDHDSLLNLYISNSSKVLIDKEKWQSQLFTREVFLSEFWFPYYHFLDFKVMVWDTSDNIPGIDWVGDKWATDFLIDLENINLKVSDLFKDMSHLEKLNKKSQKVFNKILEQKEKYDLYHKVMSPVTWFWIPEVWTFQNHLKADELYNYLEIEKNRFLRD